MNAPLPLTRPPRTPGEVIVTEFLWPLNRTQSELAAALGVVPIRLSEIITARRSVSVDTALRLENVLGPSAHFWLAMQSRLDLWNWLSRPGVRDEMSTLVPLLPHSAKTLSRPRRNKFQYDKNPWHVRFG